MAAQLNTATRSTQEKIALYRQCFSGRTDVLRTYDPRTCRVWQVKRPVTDSVILRHLRGDAPYGVYLLTGDKTTAVVVDFDSNEPVLVASFTSQACRFGIAGYIERSKSKGYHVWTYSFRKVFRPERPGPSPSSFSTGWTSRHGDFSQAGPTRFQHHVWQLHQRTVVRCARAERTDGLSR